MKRAWVLCALAAGCGDDTSTSLPAWDPTLPSASVMGTFGGFTPARGIIHLHSPFSHDACDGMPRASDGTPNEPCLQSLRNALCATRIDYAALTDHDDSMADEGYASLFHPRMGDEPVLDGNGVQIASRIHCDNGHEVLVTVGGENDLMPIMLNRHVDGTVQQRHDIYNGIDAAAVTAMRDAGAKIWIPHTEQRTQEHILAVAPDGIEIYNLHANIDPKIRPMYLGLDAYGAISSAVEFADTNTGGPEPDLALLAFLAPNEPSLARWNEQLGAGRKVAGSAGSDAHENALPVILADGERGDSYRRVMRWFGNIALTTDTRDPVAIEAAIAAGRMFAVFTLLGMPDGFAVDAGGATIGARLAPGTQLHVQPPTVRDLDASLPAPAIRTTVLHIAAGGAVTTLATSENGSAIDVTLPAGAVRIEVSMIPHHLAPYLRDLGPQMAERELPWIYTSPLYVE
jgi:hypothetical protein